MFYSLEGSWRSLFIQPSYTVKGGGGMEISQEPAFEHLTVGGRMVPCRRVITQCGQCWTRALHWGAQDVTNRLVQGECGAGYQRRLPREGA